MPNQAEWIWAAKNKYEAEPTHKCERQKLCKFAHTRESYPITSCATPTASRFGHAKRISKLHGLVKTKAQSGLAPALWFTAVAGSRLVSRTLKAFQNIAQGWCAAPTLGTRPTNLKHPEGVRESVAGQHTRSITPAASGQFLHGAKWYVSVKTSRSSGCWLQHPARLAPPPVNQDCRQSSTD